MSVISLENRLGWTSAGKTAYPTKVDGYGGALSALAHNRPNISAMSIALARRPSIRPLVYFADRRPGSRHDGGPQSKTN